MPALTIRGIDYHSCRTCGDQIERPTGTSMWLHTDPPKPEWGHTPIPDERVEEPEWEWNGECDDCGAPAHSGLCKRDAWKEAQR